MGTTAEKPQVLMSDGLPSTIASGTGACWAEATMGSAVSAVVSSAARSKGRVCMGLVVRLVVGRIGIARLGSDRSRPRRGDLLYGLGIVDHDFGCHTVQPSRPVGLVAILVNAWGVEDHVECADQIAHAGVIDGVT